MGRPAAQATANRAPAEASGASASSPAPPPAGRAPTGSRTSSSARPARTSYDSGVAGKTKWTDPRSSPPSSTSATSSTTPTAARDRRSRTNFGDAGDPLFTSPPGCVFHHQASFITGFGKFKARKAGTDFDFFPLPDINPRVHGCGHGRWRPVRHVPRHARRQVADEVPRHRRGPGHLGRRPAARCRPTRTRPTYPDDIGKNRPSSSRTPRSSRFDASDLHADRDERGVLHGMVDYAKDPGEARPDPDQTSTRSQTTPTRPRKRQLRSGGAAARSPATLPATMEVA